MYELVHVQCSRGQIISQVLGGGIISLMICGQAGDLGPIHVGDRWQNTEGSSVDARRTPGDTDDGLPHRGTSVTRKSRCEARPALARRPTCTAATSSTLGSTELSGFVCDVQDAAAAKLPSRFSHVLTTSRAEALQPAPHAQHDEQPQPAQDRAPAAEPLRRRHRRNRCAAERAAFRQRCPGRTRDQRQRGARHPRPAGRTGKARQPTT